MKSSLFFFFTILVLVVGCSASDKPEPPDLSIWGAVAGGHIELVKQHLEAGTDASETLQDRIPGYGGTRLHVAVLADQKEVAKLLLTNGADVNAKAEDEFGRMPLHWAAAIGRGQFAELLVEAGADVNARDQFGYTPLDATLVELEQEEQAKLEIADYLRKNGGKNRSELE
jgi:predicted component of type VI protein secretion system